MSLLYLAAVCREEGHAVRVVDLCFHPEHEWAEAVGHGDLYGITVMTNRYRSALRIRDLCRLNNPAGKVMVGGPHPTALPELTCRDFDVVVPGEGELPLRRLLRAWPNVPKLMPRETAENLDDLPHPARDMLDLSLYHRNIGSRRAGHLSASRGCPYSCAFCGSQDMFGRVRFHSASRVVEEIEALKSLGFQAMFFLDDTFTINRHLLYPLLDSIATMGVVFRCHGDARRNTYEDYVRLKSAGCDTVVLGIESGSQKVLDRVHKGSTCEQNLAAIRNAKRAGLLVRANFVVGLPGETWTTIEETKAFVEKSDPDTYGLYTFVPFPGCDIWKHPEEYGVNIVVDDWDQYYTVTGQNESGLVLETDTYDRETLADMKQTMSKFMGARPWRGTVEEYEHKVTWRQALPPGSAEPGCSS